MATKKTTDEAVEPIVTHVNEVEEANTDEIYPGGPTMATIDEWKQNYGQIFMTEVDDEDAFIWRALSRKEFKDIIKVDNADLLYREERVCNACILWPESYKFTDLTDGKAGIPTVLAEQIMDKSGFNPKSGAIPL
jgi:hypothetical protein